MQAKSLGGASKGAINLGTITSILGFVTALFGVVEILYRTDVVEGRSPVQRVQRAVGGDDAPAGDTTGDTSDKSGTSPTSSGAEGLPDLEITDATSGSLTVANSGSGPASAFMVRVNGAEDVSFDGLDAEASETRDVRCELLARTATVDPDDQVEESDETNNSQEVPGGVC